MATARDLWTVTGPDAPKKELPSEGAAISYAQSLAGATALQRVAATFYVRDKDGEIRYRVESTEQRATVTVPATKVKVS